MNATNTRREWSPPSNYESTYTPLAASIEHIFETYKNKGLFRKPALLSTWQSKDKKKCYEYHESSGHNTYECCRLKNEIEDLIIEGYLGKWIMKKVKSNRDGSDRDKDRGRVLRRDSDDKAKSDDVKFVRAGSIQIIFGG